MIIKKPNTSTGSGGSTVTDSTTNGNIVVDGQQLQVYDDTSLVVDSTINGNIKFKGQEIQVYDDTTLKNASHSHTNKTTLDKFGEANGSPTFNGSPISGGSGGTTITYTTPAPRSLTPDLMGGEGVGTYYWWNPVGLGYTKDIYYNSASGTPISHTGLFTTDHIPVLPNQIFSFRSFSDAGSVAGAVFDVSGNWISSLNACVISGKGEVVGTSFAKLLMPANAKTIRRSLYKPQPNGAASTDAEIRAYLDAGANNRHIILGDYTGEYYNTFAEGRVVNVPWLFNINPLNQTLITKWYGKNILMLGDSITAGNYGADAAKVLGCKVINKGSSGAQADRLWDIVRGALVISGAIDYSTADAVTIMIGTNGGATGSMADITGYADYNLYPTTYYGYVGKCIEYIQAQKSGIKIYFITPPRSDRGNIDGIVTAMKAIGQYYSIPVIDVAYNSGIGVKNLMSFTSDGTHPNAAGNKMIGTYIAHQMNAF